MADSVPFARVGRSDSGDAESVAVSPIDVFFDPTSRVSPGTLRATKVKSDMFSDCCPCLVKDRASSSFPLWLLVPSPATQVRVHIPFRSTPQPRAQSTPLVKHWPSSLGGRGIRVNVAAPGVIATEPFIVCIQPFKVGSLEIIFRLENNTTKIYSLC